MNASAAPPAELPDILRQIVAQRRQRLAAAVEETLELRDEPRLQTPANNRFLGALAARRGRAVIAEIKLGSPRLGSLVGRFEPKEQARLYAKHGAAALSVVVEPDFFRGSYEVLASCQAASGLPAIAKDFVVDPLQIDWAKRAGASAVLLIAALYPRSVLRDFADEARGLGLAPLVEVHGPADLAKLEGGEWELVGVNNRDLRSFEVDLGHSLGQVGALPAGALKVSESGLRTAADLARLRAAGFDAFLIGESLVTADDPAAKLRELCT